MNAHAAPAAPPARPARGRAGLLHMLTLCLGLLALLGAPLAGPAGAASPFAPAILVNDSAITRYELAQRAAFLRALGRSGTLEEVAREELIDDRLRLQAAEALGVLPGAAEIEAGMAEFAGRANLETGALLDQLAAEGVAPETFRDFVTAGLAWREVVGARFGPRTQVSEAEIDRALALISGPSEARVLMSEIILPADTPRRMAEAEARARQIVETVRTEAGFAEAARTFSVSASRLRGGRLDWVNLGSLPAPVASLVLTLAPGEVSAPVRLSGAIALFQLRGLEETGPLLPPDRLLDYARLVLPGASPEAAEKIRARLDTCGDLYGVARGLPEGALARQTRAPGALEPALAQGLAGLDPNETLVRGTEAPAIVMLCARNPLPEPEAGAEGEAASTPAPAPAPAPAAATAEATPRPDRGAIRRQLVAARLEAYSESYLAELRADAIIRTP